MNDLPRWTSVKAARAVGARTGFPRNQAIFSFHSRASDRQEPPRSPNGNEAEVAFSHEGHKHLRWALSSLPATATWPDPPGIRGFPSRWNLEKLADTPATPALGGPSHISTEGLPLAY